MKSKILKQTRIVPFYFFKLNVIMKYQLGTNRLLSYQQSLNTFIPKLKSFFIVAHRHFIRNNNIVVNEDESYRSLFAERTNSQRRIQRSLER